MEGSKFLIVGLVLAICAFIFQVIGLASPYWIVTETPFLKMNFGLWEYCLQSPILSHTTICRDVKAIITEDWKDAVRAMSILGMIALLISVVMTTLKLFAMKESKIPQFVAISTVFAGAVFILIAIAVFAAKMNEGSVIITPFDYHFAFAFCIIAMLTAIASGCIMIVNVVK
ncbi:uncharacterized protein LOC144619842 [Crassostrea virginica]